MSEVTTDEKRLIRMEQELDLAGRKPVRMVFKNPAKCPYCGDELWLESIKPHWFPYIHVDYGMQCPMPTCNRYYLFGLPMSKDAGLALHIWDSNPFGAMEQFQSLGDRICKWKTHGEMIPTKIFGDWFVDVKDNKELVDEIKFQWKCPICFLVEQEWYPRACDHGKYDPLSMEEKKILEDRMRSLGYLD